MYGKRQQLSLASTTQHPRGSYDFFFMEKLQSKSWKVYKPLYKYTLPPAKQLTKILKKLPHHFTLKSEKHLQKRSSFTLQAPKNTRGS